MIIPLFPRGTRAPVESRKRQALALRQCIAALADEARDAGLPLTEKALDLAIAVLAAEHEGKT